MDIFCLNLMEIIRFTTKDKKLAKIAFAIREKVFVIEQKVNPDLEYDEFEDNAQHYLVYLEKKPVATARRRKTEKGIKLERFSVLKDYRNKGIGTELLKFVLKDVIPLSKYIYIHSQINALNFYLRNGFKVIGKMFIEADIEHYFMRYEG